MAIMFYRGLSQLDGSTEICAYLSGHDRPSANSKTGPMLQTWIMLADQDPVAAVMAGTDAAVCGSCSHRGNGFKDRSCYVTIMRAPLNIHLHAKHATLDEAVDLCRRKRVRLGAYGNPSAVPYEVWTQLLAHAKGWTGYDHAWRTCDQRFRHICMASVETDADAETARSMGWRTMRTTIGTADIDDATEVLCPATPEAGRLANCYDCLLCCGGRKAGSKSVAVPVHGIQPIKAAFHVKQSQLKG